MRKNSSSSWKTLSTNIVYDNPWISVSHRDVIAPTGKEGIYGLVHFKNIAIGILPLDKDFNTWIVGQDRYTINQYSWEIPEGGGSLSVPPLESAKRELLEETGIVANNWTKLIDLHLSNSVSDEVGIGYIAQDLSFQSPLPDDTEILQIRKLPFEQVLQMTLDGEITDALAVSCILKAKILIESAVIR